MQPDAQAHGQAAGGIGAPLVHHVEEIKTWWDKYKLGSVCSLYFKKGVEVSLRWEQSSRSLRMECELTFKDGSEVAVHFKRHMDTAFTADTVPLSLTSVRPAEPEGQRCRCLGVRTHSWEHATWRFFLKRLVATVWK